MDGNLSDTENETIIATTTYITLAGTHTTETDVGQPSAESLHQETTKFRSISQEDLRRYSDVSLTYTENEEQEMEQTNFASISYASMSDLSEIKIDQIESPTPTDFYTEIEDVRQSACCKVQTIVMDPSFTPEIVVDCLALPRQTHLVAATPRSAYTNTEQQNQNLNGILRFFALVETRCLNCLQNNKDCIFCLMFFIAFVVCAAFLTVFFYKMLTLNPEALQYPVVLKDRVYYL